MDIKGKAVKESKKEIKRPMNDLSLEDAWRAAVHKRLIKEHPLLTILYLDLSPSLRIHILLYKEEHAMKPY